MVSRVIIFIFVLPVLSKGIKYDLKSVNEPINYCEEEPPPPTDNWEYLTCKDEKWLFLSVNEKSFEAQRLDCNDLWVTYDEKSTVYGQMETRDGFGDERHRDNGQLEATQTLLAKLKVKSVWDQDKRDEKDCKVFKLNEGTGKYDASMVPCEEKHIALCTFYGL